MKHFLTSLEAQTLFITKAGIIFIIQLCASIYDWENNQKNWNFSLFRILFLTVLDLNIFFTDTFEYLVSLCEADFFQKHKPNNSTFVY